MNIEDDWPICFAHTFCASKWNDKHWISIQHYFYLNSAEKSVDFVVNAKISHAK